MTLTLVWSHPYALTSLEEHRAFFDQFRPPLYPNVSHNGVFPTITPEKHSNFGQSLKGTDRVNWIQVAFAQYYKNLSFRILVAPFLCANLPSTTCIFRSVLAAAVNSISDNIYSYSPHHYSNGVLQLKVTEFHQSSSPVLASPTLRLITAISAT